MPGFLPLRMKHLESDFSDRMLILTNWDPGHDVFTDRVGLRKIPHCLVRHVDKYIVSLLGFIPVRQIQRDTSCGAVYND